MWITLLQKWRNRLVLECCKIYGFHSGVAEDSVGCGTQLLGKNIPTFLHELLDHHNPSKHQEVPSQWYFIISLKTWVFLRFEGLTVVLLRIRVFWDVPLSLGKLLWRVIMPSSSWSSSPVLGVLDAHDDVMLSCCTSTLWCFEGTVILQAVGNYLFSNTPSHPRSFESSAALLWDPKTYLSIPPHIFNTKEHRLNR